MLFLCTIPMECMSLLPVQTNLYLPVLYQILQKVWSPWRRHSDQRALGELFYVMLTELEDITFHQSMMILVEAMLQTVTSVFRVTEEQLEIFAADFYSRLPEYMQRALSYTPSGEAEAICHG